MSRTRWHPEEVHVEVLARRLALSLFPGYDLDAPAGGSPLTSVLLNRTLLEGALGTTRQPYYRGTLAKAGALLRSMVKDHPFVDGNKRIGLATTFIFLAMNGYLLVAPNEEMVAFALDLAGSEPAMDWRDVARWLRRRTVHLESRVTLPWGFPRGTSPEEVAQRLASWRATLDEILNSIDDPLANGGEGRSR